MKYYIGILACIGLFLINATDVCSQISQPNRFEVELGSDEASYTVLSGENDNLLLFRRIVNEDNQKSQLLEVLKLDTSFQIIWRNTYAIDQEFLFAKHHYHKERLH